MDCPRGQCRIGRLVTEAIEEDIKAAYTIAEKLVRQDHLKGIRNAIVEKLSVNYAENDIRGIIEHLEYRIVRNAFLRRQTY